MLLAMTKHAIKACVDKGTKDRETCEAGEVLKESMGLCEGGSPPPRTGVFINGGTLHLVNVTPGQGSGAHPGMFTFCDARWVKIFMTKLFCAFPVQKGRNFCAARSVEPFKAVMAQNRFL